MKRYFQAPISTGPGKSGDSGAIISSTSEKLEKKKRDKYVEGETIQEGKDRRAGNKARRKKQRLSKTKEKIADAKAAGDKPIKTAKLQKRQKRQEGRAERKNIRKKAKEGKIIEGKSGEYNALSKREKIKKSRKKQRE